MKIRANLILVVVFAAILISIAFLRGYVQIPGLSPEIKKSDVSSVFVVDGDTIKVWMNDSERSVRLLGINTPEKGQYYHDEATNRLRELVYNRSVTLVSDSATPDEDVYGRLLRYVFADGTNTNIILIREGYARYYPLNQSLIYGAEMEEAERNARMQNIGLWPMANISCIGITIFNYNPSGDERKNATSEYVAFKNSCDFDVNISRWTVVNKGLDIFTFPERFLVSGAKIELHSGIGNDSFSKYNSIVYWDKNKSMWNNNHDNLVMYDRNGTIILNYTY